MGGRRCITSDQLSRDLQLPVPRSLKGLTVVSGKRCLLSVDECPYNIATRLYFQAPNLDLIEQVYEDGKGWSLGSFTVNNAPPCTALAATSWMGKMMHLRVYYTSTEGLIRERGNNGLGWFDGEFMAPGSTVSVVNWDDGYGIRVRVYCDNGIYACEWIWSHDRKWIVGAPSIFPA